MSYLAKLMEGLKSFVLGADPLSPEEGRVSPRILCQYRVNMRAGGQEFFCSVVDIGTSGMCLEGVPELETGQRLELSYPLARSFEPERALEVKVMWCRPSATGEGLAAGVAFVEHGAQLQGSWVHTLLAEAGLVGNGVYQKRKHRRLSSSQKVFLRDDVTGRHLLDGRVNNLSLGGALVESQSELKPGRRVLALLGPNVNFPVLSIGAQVVACRPDPQEQHHLISLQFVEVSKQQWAVLDGLVMKMLQGHG